MGDVFQRITLQHQCDAIGSKPKHREAGKHIGLDNLLYPHMLGINHDAHIKARSKKQKTAFQKQPEGSYSNPLFELKYSRSTQRDKWPGILLPAARSDLEGDTPRCSSSLPKILVIHHLHAYPLSICPLASSFFTFPFLCVRTPVSYLRRCEGTLLTVMTDSIQLTAKQG